MEESINVRYVFMMMLAIADPEGVVIGTDVAISRRLNIPIGEFVRCIEELGSPDPNSNSQENEGRRIITSDGERGYLIVNYRTYRGLRDEDERREYMRDYMRNRRKAERGEGVATVNSRKQRKSQLAKEGASSSESSKGSPEGVFVNLPDALSTEQFKATWIEYLAYRKQARQGGFTPIGISQKWKEMEGWGPEASIVSMKTAMANGWKGTFYPKSENGSKPVPPPKEALPPPPNYRRDAR